MRIVAGHRWLRVAAAVALCASLLGVAVPAHAEPTSTVEAMTAEQAAAQGDLARMQADLEAEVQHYVALGRSIAKIRAEISQVTTEVAEMEAQLIVAQATYVERAQQIYRRDPVDLLNVLLTADSVQDLFVRATYLVKITEYDVRTMNDVRHARSETLYLQARLEDRVTRLRALQTEADQRREKIEADLELQQKRAAEIGQDLAALLVSRQFVGGEPNSNFNPETVISEANYRASGSMTAEQIQAFLDAQPGTLKNYVGSDHAGKRKTAAQMIAEAAANWGVSPAVIMTTLQKEQSLLVRSNPTQNALNWAMGCGKAESYTAYQYQGFGKQIWFGAEKLARNGDAWKPGCTLKIDGSVIHPSNPATYSLYRYTPHFRGNMSFWLIYWRYFGDPLA